MCQKCERCVYVLSASVHETALTAFRKYRALTFTRHLLDVKNDTPRFFSLKVWRCGFSAASTQKTCAYECPLVCVCAALLGLIIHVVDYKRRRLAVHYHFNTATCGGTLMDQSSGRLAAHALLQPHLIRLVGANRPDIEA